MKDSQEKREKRRIERKEEGKSFERERVKGKKVDYEKVQIEMEQEMVRKEKLEEQWEEEENGMEDGEEGEARGIMGRRGEPWDGEGDG